MTSIQFISVICSKSSLLLTKVIQNHRIDSKSLERIISSTSLAAAGLTPHRFRSNNPHCAGRVQRLFFRILRNTETAKYNDRAC